jgi:hypothetical protein
MSLVDKREALSIAVIIMITDFPVHFGSNLSQEKDEKTNMFE